MKNYFYLNGTKIELTEEQAHQIANSFNVAPKMFLAEKAVGDIARIGDYEFIVLKQGAGETHLILKGLLGEDDVVFGEDNNDYGESNIRPVLSKFADELSSLVGEENVIEHDVDLTSDDGLKDYGNVVERVSLLTTEQYREFVDVLDKERLEKWWWLATPHSTKRHENDRWVKVVSPSGGIDYYNYDYFGGVRPFCILSSDVLVST